MLKNSMLSITAAMFLLCSAGLAQAQTPTPDEQAKAQTTTDRDRADGRDFHWGLLGLLGLLGLAGLTGRGREVVATRRATSSRNEPL
jgi:MYXO-CTERM domain-containing protein